MLAFFPFDLWPVLLLFVKNHVVDAFAFVNLALNVVSHSPLYVAVWLLSVLITVAG